MIFDIFYYKYIFLSNIYVVLHAIIDKVIFMEGVQNTPSKYSRGMGHHSSLTSVVFLVCIDHISLNSYASQDIF